jgi:hypothetical protein
VALLTWGTPWHSPHRDYEQVQHEFKCAHLRIVAMRADVVSQPAGAKCQNVVYSPLDTALGNAAARLGWMLAAGIAVSVPSWHVTMRCASQP